MTVRTNEYEKSIMYSVQVACLERLKADGLMGDEEKEYLLKKLKTEFGVLTDVDIIGG